MKQSTKLLSLVLALVLACSFVGVIGNAALAKGDVKYDIIDDAQLTPEQVADYQLCENGCCLFSRILQKNKKSAFSSIFHLK